MFRRFGEKIKSEKKRTIFQVPELIDLHQKAYHFANEARNLFYVIEGNRLGFMLPELYFSETIQNDYKWQSAPHQLDGWNIDGINYMTFKEKNIALRKRLMDFRANLDANCSVADQALEKLQQYYGKKDYEQYINELIAKRDDPARRGECEQLSEKMTSLRKPIEEFQKDRETLTKAKDMFKEFGTLIRSTARARQDKFCEEYPFIQKKR